MMGCLVMGAVLLLGGCNDKADIRQAYDFSLSSWYLQKSAKSGEEIEIRFYLDREGDFKDATYQVGYIQLDGSGRVYNTDRRILTNREPYELAEIPGLDVSNPLRLIFTLFYRPSTDKKSDLRFFVTDGFGQLREYDVSFNPDSSGDDK